MIEQMYMNMKYIITNIWYYKSAFKNASIKMLPHLSGDQEKSIELMKEQNETCKTLVEKRSWKWYEI